MKYSAQALLLFLALNQSELSQQRHLICIFFCTGDIFWRQLIAASFPCVILTHLAPPQTSILFQITILYTANYMGLIYYINQNIDLIPCRVNESVCSEEESVQFHVIIGSTSYDGLENWPAIQDQNNSRSFCPLNQSLPDPLVLH